MGVCKEVAVETPLNSAIVRFTGKPSKGSADEVAAKQKRDASKRNTILASKECPTHIRAKWDQLCKQRTKGKNSEKSMFTSILLRDSGQWTDMYWQASAEESHGYNSKRGGRWILRSKAEQDCGGGKAGAEEIDKAIAAGIYQVRTVFAGKGPDGKPIKVAFNRSDNQWWWCWW